jgi:hypothetical protein
MSNLNNAALVMFADLFFLMLVMLIAKWRKVL